MVRNWLKAVRAFQPTTCTRAAGIRRLISGQRRVNNRTAAEYDGYHSMEPMTLRTGSVVRCSFGMKTYCERSIPRGTVSTEAVELIARIPSRKRVDKERKCLNLRSKDRSPRRRRRRPNHPFQV